MCFLPSKITWQVLRGRNVLLRCLHGYLLFHLIPCSTVTFKETVSYHPNQGNNSPSLSPYIIHSVYYHMTQYYIHNITFFIIHNGHQNVTQWSRNLLWFEFSYIYQDLSKWFLLIHLSAHQSVHPTIHPSLHSTVLQIIYPLFIKSGWLLLISLGWEVSLLLFFYSLPSWLYFFFLFFLGTYT